MLLTETLNQWKLLLEREMRGEKIDLEPGYAEFYEKWKETKGETLNKLSAEERVQLFSDDLDDEIQKEMEALIPQKMKAQAKRGDLCLVSTDEGKHFNQVLTLDQLLEHDPLKIRFLSPTLQSVTNNYEQLKEEQNLLHVAKNLRANHCLVERGYVENHVVHLDIIHTRLQASQVEVDLQSPNTNLEYVFKAKDGTQKRVQETQLPEEFGVIEPAVPQELIFPLSAIALMKARNRENEENKNQAIQGEVASLTAVTELARANTNENLKRKALFLLNRNQANENKKQIESASQTSQLKVTSNLQTAASKFTANVMVSKAAIANRIIEQKERVEIDKRKYVEAVKAQNVSRAQMWAKQKEEKQKRKEHYAKAEKSRKFAAGIGAALTGTAVSGFGFLSFWVTHLNSN